MLKLTLRRQSPPARFCKNPSQGSTISGDQRGFRIAIADEVIE
jgi:hypothetical protein